MKALESATRHLFQLQEALENNDKNKFIEILNKISVVNDIIGSGEENVSIAYSRIMIQAINKWIN